MGTSSLDQPPMDLYKLTTLCHYLHILLGYLYTQFLLLLLLAVVGLCCYAGFLLFL